jgi:hypothetical protein
MKNLLKAMYQFADIVKPILKDADNPFFKSKFAALEQIQASIKEPLHKCGLVITQPSVVVEGSHYVKSILFHVESGEFIESLFPIIALKGTPQDYGSSTSYPKRYSLSGLLNLIIQGEDDDAETAEGRGKSPAQDNKAWLNKESESFAKVKDFIVKGGDIKEVEKKYKISKEVRELLNK